jgi:hypothetical protein
MTGYSTVTVGALAHHTHQPHNKPQEFRPTTNSGGYHRAGTLEDH